MPNSCSKCGVILREDWNVCPECGEPIYQKQEELKAIKTNTKSCSKCGIVLREDWNICPECGESISQKREDLKKLRAKTKSINQKITEKNWILTFIAGIIGILSLLTSASTISISLLGEVLLSMDSWMWGLNIYYEIGVGYDVFFTANQFILGVDITSLVVLIIINVILIGISLWTRNDVFNLPVDLMHIYLTIGLVIGTLIYIIGNEIISWIFIEDTYWGLFNLGFALTGQFIAALMTAISYGLGKRYYYSPDLSI